MYTGVLERGKQDGIIRGNIQRKCDCGAQIVEDDASADLPGCDWQVSLWIFGLDGHDGKRLETDVPEDDPTTALPECDKTAGGSGDDDLSERAFSPV